MPFPIKPRKLAPPIHYLQAQCPRWPLRSMRAFLPYHCASVGEVGEAVWPYPLRHLLLTNLGPWV